jgi:hypothetical protein
VFLLFYVLARGLEPTEGFEKGSEPLKVLGGLAIFAGILIALSSDVKPA